MDNSLIQEKAVEIFREVQFFRLSMEVADAEREIFKNRQISTNSLTGAKKFFTSVGNDIKNAKAEKLYRKKSRGRKGTKCFFRSKPGIPYEKRQCI